MHSWPKELLLLFPGPKRGFPARILWISLFLFFTSTAFSQSVTMSLSNVPLEKAFSSISRQTGYRFIYTRSDIQLSHPVTLEVTRQPLDTVLQLLFADQPLTYVIDTKHIVIRRREERHSQDASIDLRGRILDEEGNPLDAVSIQINGSERGTTTNSDGYFFLKNVSPASVLKVTCIGYLSIELPIKSKNYLLIRLTSTTSELDKSVVVAYGRSTQRFTTSTVSTLKREQIRSQPVSNPLSTLVGQIPGLQVTQTSGTTGSEVIVRLRGQNSLASGNNPLIIIDGMPYPSSSLNSSPGGGAFTSPLANLNPEDIERIEVLKDADATAIYGSRGANGVILITTVKPKKGKMSVGLRSSIGFGKATRFMNLLNVDHYLEMRKEAFSNDGRNPTPGNAPDLLLWDSTWQTDWQRVLLGNTMQMSDIYLTVSGGSDKTQIFFGIGRHRETTVLPWDDFGEEKYSGNIRLVHQSADGKWDLDLKSAYYRGDILLPQSDISNQIFLPPNAPPLYDENGELNWENSSWVNPMSLLMQQYNSLNETFLNDIRAAVRPFRGFEISANLGVNRILVRERSRIPKKSFNPAFSSSASAGFGNNSIFTLISEPQVSYSGQAGRTKFDALAGMTVQFSEQESRYAYGNGYLNDGLLGSLSAASSVSITDEQDIRYRYVGLFARAQFNFINQILLSLSARRDGSSRYGPTHRYSNFASAAGAWIFTNSKWLKNSKLISFGKFKISYGTTGNDQIGDYNYLDLYQPQPYSYLNQTPLTATRLFNPDYSWELVRKLDFGLNLGFLKDKLILDFHYYLNTTNNQLITYALPATTGFSGVLKNLPAKIRNSGIEMEIFAHVIRKSSVQLSLGANFTIPKNKLIQFDGIESSSYVNTYIVGQPLFISRRYKVNGVDQQTGNYVFEDYDKDGRITSANDREAIVFTGQQWYGSFRSDLTINRWHFVLLAQWVEQLNGSNYLARFGRPGSFSNQPDLVLGRWRNVGDVTEIQKYVNSNALSNVAYNNYRLSDAAYSNASFLRLRNAAISYEVLKNEKGHNRVQQLQIFVQGQNLFTITSYSSLDPETKTVMPPIRVVTMGVTLGL